MENNLLSHDTEISLLSILIRNPTLFFNLKNLKVWMFSSDVHKQLFQTILDLNSQSLVADVNLILETLKDKKELDKVGGVTYLQHLTTVQVPDENLSEYERLIVDAYKLRILSTLSVKLINEVKTKSPEDLIEETHNILDKLSLASGGEKTRPLDQILDQTLSELKIRSEHPGIVGIGMGLERVDYITGGACGGEVWYIVGRPGSGKTGLMCNWIMDAGKNNIPVLVIEREMKDTSLAERLLAMETGIPTIEIRNGRINKEQLEILKAAAFKIKGYPIHVDTDMSEGYEYSLATIKRYKSIKDIKLAFIDYIQLETEREENQTQELGSLSRKLKRLSLGSDIGIIAFSQANRLLELRDDKRPRLSDLRQCGNLEEDADFVVGLYRPMQYEANMKNSKIMEYILLKVRQGPPGTIILDFHGDTNKITEHKR